jgi:hypothetical protein
MEMFLRRVAIMERNTRYFCGEKKFPFTTMRAATGIYSNYLFK